MCAEMRSRWSRYELAMKFAARASRQVVVAPGGRYIENAEEVEAALAAFAARHRMDFATARMEELPPAEQVRD
jgi:hypothetical protein